MKATSIFLSAWQSIMYKNTAMFTKSGAKIMDFGDFTKKVLLIRRTLRNLPSKQKDDASFCKQTNKKIIDYGK